MTQWLVHPEKVVAMLLDDSLGLLLKVWFGFILRTTDFETGRDFTTNVTIQRFEPVVQLVADAVVRARHTRRIVRIGYVGAAASTTITYVAAALWMALVCSRQLGVPIRRMFVPAPIAALEPRLSGRSAGNLTTRMRLILPERHPAPSPLMGEGGGHTRMRKRRPPSLSLPHKGGGNDRAAAPRANSPQSVGPNSACATAVGSGTPSPCASAFL